MTTDHLPVLTYRDRPCDPATCVRVDLDTLMVGGLLVQAASGGGKSRAIRQLLEETHGRVQHLVIDPEGEFPSLRERFDYLHAAPIGGDVVATPKTARLLCRRLVESGASAVMDIYDLKLEEKREFVRLFLEELMSLPRSLWKPILVVIDEADLFAPQKSEASSTDAVIDINGRGRKRGYRIVLTTRRLSNLHKDAADLQNRMIGLTGLDVDVKRAGDELGMDKDTRKQLPQLKPGEFYVYGPAIAPTPRLVRTGEIVTSHPKAGKIGAVAPPAPAAIRALIAQLADLPHEAEQEARTLADLQTEVRTLRADLARARKGGGFDDAEVKRRVEQAVTAAVARAVEQERAAQRSTAWALQDRNRRGMESVRRRFVEVGTKLMAISDTLTADAAELAKVIEADHVQTPATAGAAVLPITGNPLVRVLEPVPVRRAIAPDIGRAEPTEGLNGTQQRMLDALARLASVGIAPAPRNIVAALTDQSPSSSGWDKNISRLRTKGLASYPTATTVTLTDEGKRAARTSASILSLADLHGALKDMVSGPQWRMCEALIAAFPYGMDRSALAAQSNQSAQSSGWDKNLSTLRTLGLIEYPDSTSAIATELLMPKELR